MIYIKEYFRKEELKKVFVFEDFKICLDFINKVIKLADDINHHPTKIVWEGKKVSISSLTHDVGEVTEKDYYLMKEIENIHKKLNKNSKDF